MIVGGAIVWTSETNVDPISLSAQVESAAWRAAEEKSLLQAQVNHSLLLQTLTNQCCIIKHYLLLQKLTN